MMIMAALLCGCTSKTSTTNTDVRPDPNCRGLFGAPNEKSGFDSDACTPSCQCTDTQATADELWLDSPLFSARHVNPMQPPTADPYILDGGPLADELDDVVCSIEVSQDRRSYTLATVPRTGVQSSQVTHTGPCGLCSSLQDFHVYASETDWTDPVRSCGIMGISNGMVANISCLEDIGFSSNCATIWYFNTLNTRTQCLDECLANLNTPYVDAMGELNPCLECDERQSGPVFKQTSGRTRRNSAIPSAICRPCNSVSSLNHVYLTQ